VGGRAAAPVGAGEAPAATMVMRKCGAAAMASGERERERVEKGHSWLGRREREHRGRACNCTSWFVLMLNYVG
jgi:hypothetical protein